MMINTRGKRPVIAITVGDCNGIGPEVVLKSVRQPSVKNACMPVLVGPADIFYFYARKLHLENALAGIPIVESSSISRRLITPGKISAAAGEAAAKAIAAAVELANASIVQAVVTAPVSKRALHKAHIRFPGQTEMLQQLSASRSVAMMLVSPTLRVGLATIHVPLRNVARVLTRPLLRERVRLIHDALRNDWNIKKPRIAVLALNPHAGEGGDLGEEDDKVVAPVVRELQRKRMRVEGPFPADAFFGRYKPGLYDAVVAMYHDQGLIPLKMSAFCSAVNVSVGLPIIRTSPDHGTAFEIAGKGIADPASMIEAIMLASTMAAHRMRSKRNHR